MARGSLFVVHATILILASVDPSDMSPSVPVVLAAFLASVVGGCIAGDDGAGNPGASDPDPMVSGNNTTVTWGDVASATIRPGASLGGYCTFNFLFTDGDGSAYIGTAGHCTDSVGERVALGAGGEIGAVVYDSDENAGANELVDFSLIRLDAEAVADAHPMMLGWDGPTGVLEPSEASLGDQVAFYGYGLVLGENEATRPRFGVLLGIDDELYSSDMPAVNGDSGSPIIHMDTGKALGIVSHYGFGATPPTTDEGPVMTFILAELAKAGFVVELAVA